MRKSLVACAVFALMTSSAFADFENRYATVRGWEVWQGDSGCLALHPSRGDILWDILVPPAGGWEVRFDDLAGHPDDSEFPVRIIVDGARYTETYFSYSGSFVGVLPLDQRLALSSGSNVTFLFADMRFDFSLKGSTAAMLKLEECWHRMTGYDANISNKRGAYAFK